MIIDVERWIEKLELLTDIPQIDVDWQYNEHFATLRLVIKNASERKDVPKTETLPKETPDNSDENKAKVG